MYQIKHFADWGLVVVAYDEPFSVSDLLRVAEVLGVPGLGKDRHRALLIDLRRVAVTGVSGSDSRKFIERRKMRTPGALAEPAAFLIRGDQDYGNIRMHNLWSEALGLRKEEDTLITTDLDAALSWLAGMTKQPGLPQVMREDLQGGP
jgi:hypothetical protein